MRVLAAVLLSIAATAAAAQPVDLSGGVRAINGDTVAVEGHQYRLIGCDTPETTGAKCNSERERGERATARLREIISGRQITLDRVRCSCLPGQEGSQQCNLGRRCGILKAAGADVCTTLINEGLARQFVCGAVRCPPRKPWCNAAEQAVTSTIANASAISGEMIDVVRALDNLCRGSTGDTPNLDKICATRDQAWNVLNKLGYCFGKKGQAGYLKSWHKCTSESER